MENYFARRRQLDREMPWGIDLYAGLHDFVKTYAKTSNTAEAKRQGGMGHVRTLQEATKLWQHKSENLRKIAVDDDLSGEDFAIVGQFIIEDFDCNRTPQGKVIAGYYDRDSVMRQIARGLRVAQGLSPEPEPAEPRRAQARTTASLRS